MIMHNILIFYPDKNVKNAFYKSQNVIFFDESGWWHFSKNKRINTKISNDLIDLQKVDFEKLISTMRFWGPLWSRMIGKGDQLELIYRKVGLLILNVASDIERLKIKKAIFMTGVTHHIDSLVFDYACLYLKIDKIFLYREVVAGRLIPIMQRLDFPSKIFLNKNVSKYNYKKALVEFKLNKADNNFPVSNYVFSRSKNFYFSLFRTLYLDSKFIFRNIIKFLLLKFKCKFLYEPNIFSFIYQTYPFQLTFQILQLKEALKYYESKCLSNEELELIKKKAKTPFFLIAANFQPEATTFPEGWDCSNHIDLVIQLRKKGVKEAIFYKEHPETFSYIIGAGSTGSGMMRSIDYYRQLESLNCFFIQSNFSLSVDSINNNWYIPVTISGTIALERSLFGFPTIVAGRPWFHGLPGCLYLNDIKKLTSLNKSFVKKDKRLEKNAFNYLLNKLNDKTLVNNAGIGDSKLVGNKKVINEYIKNFKKLILEIR